MPPTSSFVRCLFSGWIIASCLALAQCVRGQPSQSEDGRRPRLERLSVREGELPLAIVLGEGAEVLDFTGPLEVFSQAATPDGRPLFHPYFVAATREPVVVSGNLRVVPDYTFSDAPAPMVVVIPAMRGDGRVMHEWIRRVSARTDVTMSVCNGAFVLARTGLLDGKEATAHHGGYFRFAGEFPQVQLRRGHRFTEAGNLATAGGVSSGIDLALHVVARYLGDGGAREVADGIEYSGPGWRDITSNAKYERMLTGDAGHPKCPLCQMDADPAITSTFQGEAYAFCSLEEKRYFDAHPEVTARFLAEDAAR